MFQLGNRFGVKKPKPVIPASPLVNAGTQENLDRVIKSLEAKRAELTEVRSRLATLRKLPRQGDSFNRELLASSWARYLAGGNPANASWGRSSL